eukprot:1003995-Pyramimonas_sp.AAC.1
MVRFRGRGARDYLAALTTADGCFLPVPAVNDVPDQKLCLVHHYKHLGEIIQSDGGIGADAHHKTKQALKTSSPLAFRVVGSPS